MAHFVYSSADIKQDVTPTKVKIIVPCWIHGQPRQLDEVVIVGHQDAIDLRSMGRVVILGK